MTTHASNYTFVDEFNDCVVRNMFYLTLSMAIWLDTLRAVTWNDSPEEIQFENQPTLYQI